MKSLSNISRWILKKKKGNKSNKSNHYGLAIYGGLYKLKWEYKANKGEGLVVEKTSQRR